MPKYTYPLKTNARTGTITVEELSTKVLVTAELSKSGEFGDEADLFAALQQVLLRYEDDPRPIELTSPLYGQTASVSKVGDDTAYVVVTNPSQQ